MPSSIGSSARSRLRQSEQQSLGLEDELDFGSDEDLMETIGEIEVADDAAVPELPSLTATQSNTSSRRRPKSSRSARSLKKDDKRSRSSSSSSLASSTHLLPPLPPVPSGSSLDLPSDMFGSPDSRKRGSILGAFKVKGLRKWRDDQSSKASFVTDSQSASSQVSLSKIVSNTSSRPSFSTSVAPSSISTAPHLGPLPLFDSVSVSEQRQAGVLKQPTPIGHDVVVPKQAPQVARAAEDTDVGRKSWSAGEISSAILPAFPATLASLEPITVLVAQAAKRPPSSIMAGRNSQSKGSRWSPCTLVFTLFKVSTGEDSVDDERTVAHVHVFSQKQPTNTGMSGVRRSKSSAGFAMDPHVPRVETERRYITRQSAASVSDELTDADGRKVVLRVLLGTEDRTKGNEWVLEMKDTTRLQEWVRQINKTAIMINAEELGYGQAIQSAFESSSVSADELAQRLSAHARAVQQQRDAPEQRKEVFASPTASQPDVRSSSVEAAQAAALSRSRSAEEPASVTQDKSSIESSPDVDRKIELVKSDPDSLSLGTLNLGQHLAFPAPPSALPPQRPIRAPAPIAMPPPTYGTPVTYLPPVPHSYPIGYPGAPVPVVNGEANGSADGQTQTAPSDEGSAQSLTNGSTPSLLTGLPGVNGRAQLSPNPATAVFAPAPPGSVPSPQAPETEVLEDMPAVRPPTPPRRSPNHDEPARPATVSALQNRSAPNRSTPSIASTTNSGTSVTSRLRKLRGKPQVIDIMAEFNSIEAENTPPPEDEEPIRDDRERRIRFAEG